MDGFVGALPAGDTRAPTLQALRLAHLLRRNLWLILLLGVLGAGAGFLQARTLPRTFTASASITVEGERFAIPELQGALRNDAAPDPMPWVRTEVQALTSRAMISQAAMELHLDAMPEFNPALRPLTLLQRAKDAVTGLVAPLLPRSPAVSSQVGAKTEDSAKIGGERTKTIDDAVIDTVNHALAIFQDNRSLVIAVSFTAEDPQLASRFVNTLIADYIATRARRRSDANQGANDALLQRIDAVRSDLAGIEQQMQDLRNKAELVSSPTGKSGHQQLEELTTAAARATLERSQLEVSYDRATAAAKQGASDVLATVLNSPTISHLRDQEASASGRVAELATHYGPDYPGVRSASAQLATVRRQIADEAGRIVASIGAQLRVARAQEADVLAQLAQARRDAVVSENKTAQLDQLQQEATSRRALYQTLLERAQQTVAQPAVAETPDVRVISPAAPPDMPSGPNGKLAALMGGGAGGLLGCLLALTRLRSPERIGTTSELADSTGVPVLASLSPGLVRAGRGVLAGTPVMTGADVAALRDMRARLMLAGRSGAPRLVAILPLETGRGTGAMDAVTLAAALARVAAAGGDRVLLIESDRTNQPLGRVLGRGKPSPSLATRDGLDPGDWREAIVADRQDGLDLLLTSTRSAMEGALDGPHVQNLLVETRSEYDLVVLEASAAAADALSLAQRADLTIAVVSGRPAASAVQDSIGRLRAASRAPIVAVLMAAG